MGSPVLWYGKFLDNLVVPPPPGILKRNDGNETVFYSLTIQSIDFKELKKGVYGIHLFFFDIIDKQYFGRQWRGDFTSSPYSSCLPINSSFFFHSSIRDERVLIVLEIVKVERNPFVIGWTAMPVYQRNKSITDFAHLDGLSFLKHQIYRGSCKALFYLNELAEIDSKVKKADGVLLGLLQTNQNMLDAACFMPEYFFTSRSVEEHIPGIRLYTNGTISTSDTFTAILDNATIAYGADSSRVEFLVIDLLTKDHCYKLNKSPQDKSVHFNLTIVERRLRIGVHNGLNYLEEPICLYLSARDEIETGSLSYRKRSRSFSRATAPISETANLFARNSTKLTKLCADPIYAIVFSLDYLVGSLRSDGIISESQLIMVAWGAWSPYQETGFTIADTITVPLVGGPRPNPDDCLSLSLRSVLSKDVFADIRPQFNLRFNFAIVDSTNTEALLRIPTTSGMSNSRTPLPRPDVSAHAQEAERRAKLMPEATPFVEVFHPDIGSVPDEQPVSDEHSSEHTLSLVYPTNTLQKSRSMPALGREEVSRQSSQTIDSNFARVTAFPRSVSSYFSKHKFPQILDRNGASPTFINATSAKRSIDLEMELRSQLATNEIILQLMGINILQNAFYSTSGPSSTYLFTLKFYRFEQIITERLLAQSTAGSEWKSKLQPSVLRRVDENNCVIEENGTGFMIKYVVEKSSIPPTDADDLFQYLFWNRLYIDVWDADSIVYVGTVAIPLKFLCRQNTEAVSTELQCPIVQNGLPGEPAIMTGLLFLKMANIGHPSDRIGVYGGKKSRHPARICKSNNTAEHHRLRAKTLNGIHESALQKFLTMQKLDLYQRKEDLFSNDRIQRLQQWNEMKKNIAPFTVNASVKKFIFHEELEAYKTLRNKSKAATLLKAVFKGITSHYTIHAKYGQVEFFEFLLQNTFAERVICSVDIADPKLSLILNSDEWKFFKDKHNLKTPLERDLFNVDENKSSTLLLNPLESVYLPFKYDPHEGGANLPTDLDCFEMRVIFKKIETDEPIAILEVLVENRNFALSSSFKWFYEERRKISRVLRIQGIKDNKKIVAVRTSNPIVLCSLRNRPGNGSQEALLTCNAGEPNTTSVFVVMLYGDRYYSNLLATWYFTVHATYRLNIEAIQAQTTKIPLLIRPSPPNDALLQLHCSSEAVSFVPKQPFFSTCQSLADIQALFSPNFTGKRLFIVTLVEISTSRLLCSWMVSAVVGEPNIVKTYEIAIPLAQLRQDQLIQKKILLENAYSIPQTFRVHTSNENLVSVHKEYYQLKGNSSCTIQLNFHPLQLNESTNMQVLVFVENAETNQQEEAYAIKILYSM